MNYCCSLQPVKNVLYLYSIISKVDNHWIIFTDIKQVLICKLIVLWYILKSSSIILGGLYDSNNVILKESLIFFFLIFDTGVKTIFVPVICKIFDKTCIKIYRLM